MNMKKNLILNVVILFLAIVTNVFADGGHGSEPRKKPSPVFTPTPSQTEDDEARDVKGKLIGVFHVDGFEVKVKVVDVIDSISDGGSHNILVKINFNHRIKRNLSVKATVLFADNTAKEKSFMELGDWYLAGYDLGTNDSYEVLLSFDNNKHQLRFMGP